MQVNGTYAIETHSFICMPNKEFSSLDAEVLLPASRINPLLNAAKL
jgi:hypothetical protein